MNALRHQICGFACARDCVLLVVALVTVACSSSPPTIPAIERRLTKEEFGENWPFTVAAGVVACDQSRSAGRAIVFTTGGVTYGVNDTAKSVGYPAIDPLRRSNLSPGRPRATTVERVPASERQAIFAAVVACEDRARENAKRRYPRADRRHPQFNRFYFVAVLLEMAHLETALRDRCNGELRREHRLSDHELGLIRHEGIHYGWPPRPPVRVSVGPIIGIGLELCRFEGSENRPRRIW